MPNDKRVETFADYVLSTYIEDSALFPPSVWAEIPSTARRKNNGPETFHAHYNEQLYAYTHLCSSFWIALLKFRLPHISSHTVQALTQSEVVIIPRKKLLCWKSIGSLKEEN